MYKGRDQAQKLRGQRQQADVGGCQNLTQLNQERRSTEHTLCQMT